MRFDEKTFTTILETIESRISKFYKNTQRAPHFRIHKPAGEDEVKIVAFGFNDPAMSAHRQLLRDKLVSDITDDFEQLDGVLRRAFPVLDNDLLAFELEPFEAKSAHGAKYRFCIRITDASLKGPGVLMPTVLKKLTALHDRIGHLPRGARKFLVNDIVVPAATPRDAARVWIALHRPDLFEAQNPGQNMSLTVSELTPVSVEAAVA